MNNFLKAMEDTQLFVLELWDAKENDDKNDENTFREKLGMVSDKENAVETVPKPEKPVFSMNKHEVSMYFGTLLKYCYARERILKYKLWVKKDKTGKVTEPATDLDIYDDKAKDIMPREDYWGPNVENKLKHIC